MTRKPIYMSIKSFANLIDTTLKSDRQMIVCITGTTGTGKSTLAIWILKALYKINGFDLKLDEALVYSAEEFAERYKTNPKYHGVIVDEAINLAYSLDFQTKESSQIVKIMNLYRTVNNITFWILPNFWNLNKSIRDGLVDVWINIPKRSMSYVLLPDKNPFVSDRWYKAENEKLFRGGGRNNNFENNPTRCKNFAGIMMFKKLPDKVEAIYNEVKFRKRAELDLLGKESEIKKNEKPKAFECPECQSGSFIYLRKDEVMLCKKCGHRAPREEVRVRT